MSYLDFDLEIGAGRRRVYPVFVIGSPAGEAHEFIHFPFNEQALDTQLVALQQALLRSSSKYRKILSPEEQIVQTFGRALFDALFTGEVKSCYDVSQREAYHQGKGLRLKLRIQSPELASLPWEFLYDKRQAEYICLSNNTPIVRYLDLPQSPRPLAVTPPLSILGMVASPNNLPELDIEGEKLRVEKSLETLKNNGLVKLTWLSGRTWQHLQRAMRNDTWHIFHFIGHGGFNAQDDEGLISLEDDEENGWDLSATDLGRLLVDHRSLRLIVLNSCDGAKGSKHDIFSSTAAILVRRGMPAVLAMQYEITDTAAIELARVFYETLADGLPVDMAVAEARKAISLRTKNTLEWGTPVLYMRSPDGVLFDLHLKRDTKSMSALTQNAPSVDEQVSLWLKARASNSDQTFEAYVDYSTQFRDVLQKNGLDLNSEDESVISSLVESWAAKSKKGGEIATNTYNQRLSTIKSFYKFACQQGWMRTNPIERVQRREEPDRNLKPLDIEKVINALTSIDRSHLLGKRDYALLLILLTTERSVNEVRTLRCSDIASSEKGAMLTFRRCKGGKVKYATLRMVTTQALKDYLVEVYGNEWPPDAPVWLSFSNNGKGTPIGYRAIAGVCQKYLGISKVERIKHTAAAIRQRVEIENLLDIDTFVSTEQPELFH